MTGRRYEPSLLFKGLLLIAVPLVFQLVIAGTMTGLQHAYEQDLSEQARAHDIAYHSTQLDTKCTALLLDTLMNHIFKAGSSKPAVDVADIGGEFKTMEALIGNNDKREMGALQIFYNDVSYLLRASQRIKRLGESGMSALQQNVDIVAKAQPWVDELGRAMSNLNRQFVFVDEHAVLEVARIKLQMRWTLSLALLLSIALFFLLLKFVTGGLHRSLNAIAENIELFKQGKELRATNSGSDEIGQLDSAFHTMANDIRESEEFKKAFLAMISHDLRTPLSSVGGFFELLEVGALGSVPKQALTQTKIAHEHVEKLIKLISDFLDLEKIQAGKLTVSPQLVKLTDVAADAQYRIEQLSSRNGITVDTSSLQGELSADPDRLSQVLANLLTNAIVRSPRGASVTATATLVDNFWEVQVADSGPPIESQYHDAIFDPLKQKELSAITIGANAVSLPLCQAIVKLHGGTIGIISDADTTASSGTTSSTSQTIFWFRIPTP